MLQRWKKTNAPGKRQLVLTAMWVLFTPIVIVSPLKSSLTFLVAISMYTVIVGHWSAFQAATPTEGGEDDSG